MLLKEKHQFSSIDLTRFFGIEDSNDADLNIIYWVRSVFREKELKAFEGPELGRNLRREQVDALFLHIVDDIREYFAIRAAEDLPKLLVNPDGSAPEDIEVVERIASLIKSYETLFFYPFRYIQLDEQQSQQFEKLFKFQICSLLDKVKFLQYVGRYMSKESVAGSYKRLRNTINKLYQLGYESATEQMLASLCMTEIEGFVDRYAGVKSEKVLPAVCQLVNEQLLMAVYELIPTQHYDSSLETTFYTLARDCLFRLRSREAFDLIASFPESKPALEELCQCISSSHHRSHLVSVFQTACHHRLLHAGVNTVDIVAFYISCIQAFLIIDPRGVLLDRVCRPIRKYLRDREDTVSLIVKGLLSEEAESSSSKLAVLATYLLDRNVDGSTAGRRSELQDDSLDPNWNPDPIDALPDFRRDRLSDVIQSLLSLYERKDMFIVELTAVISKKLLQTEKYQLEFIQPYVEALKRKFGDNDLSVLDVMTRDIANSEKLDAEIHNSCDVSSNVHGKILSRLYWPAFKADKVELPEVISGEISKYEKRFEALKAKRKLNWATCAGTVKLSLQFKDRTVRFQVPPDEAALIQSFNSDSKESAALTVQKLCETLKAPERTIRRLISAWTAREVLYWSRDSTGEETVRVVEDYEEFRTQQSSLSKTSHNQDANRENAQNDFLDKMNGYLPFITGMLTNLGSLPLERIHSLLSMFVPKETNPYTATEKQLETFMTYLCEEEKVEYSSGTYKLKK